MIGERNDQRRESEYEGAYRLFMGGGLSLNFFGLVPVYLCSVSKELGFARVEAASSLERSINFILSSSQEISPSLIMEYHKSQIIELALQDIKLI